MKKLWTIASGLGPEDSATPRLEVRFSWQQDRFRHQVILVTDDGERPVLESCEGDDQQDFPPSPPLQDMSVERRPGTQVALAVGMAGCSLWSLSVQAMEGLGGLEFDWACTARGGQIWPQNCYLLPTLPDTDNSAAAPAASELAESHPNGHVVAAAGPIAGPDRSAGRSATELTLHEWRPAGREPYRLVLRAVRPDGLLLIRYGGTFREAGSVTKTDRDVKASLSPAVLWIRQAAVEAGEPATEAPSGKVNLRWQYRLQIHSG